MALASRLGQACRLQRCLRARPFAAQRAAAGVRSAACAAAAGGAKQRLVFLGTPEVAAIVLDELLSASKAPDSTFEVAAVISQPGKPKGRGNKGVPTPSPVEALARQAGVPDDRILCPKSARDATFLEAFAQLQPDLCVTAAYGNMLPAAFLSIPKHGTLNIHPSLLPLYRGAAPVQRALQDGVAETGVSVAFTVLACDAGPVLAQERVAPGPDETAPQLLERLFRLGTRLLLSQLPAVWSGEAARAAVPQDAAAATHAPKIAKEEAYLDFESKSAQQLHDQVRAFAGWPGAHAFFAFLGGGGGGGDGGISLGACEVMQWKVVAARVAEDGALPPLEPPGRGATGPVMWGAGGRMLIPCDGGGALEVLAVQQPGKKPAAAKDVFNGLNGRALWLMPSLVWERSWQREAREAAVAAGLARR